MLWFSSHSFSVPIVYQLLPWNRICRDLHWKQQLQFCSGSSSIQHTLQYNQRVQWKGMFSGYVLCTSAAVWKRQHLFLIARSMYTQDLSSCLMIPSLSYVTLCLHFQFFSVLIFSPFPISLNLGKERERTLSFWYCINMLKKDFP